MPSSRRGEIRKAREQEARRIESDARFHLNTIVVHIAAGDTNDISVIQRQHSREVGDIVRTAATDAYIAGVNYVAQTKQKMHRTYLNTADIANIKAITHEFEGIFWRRLANVLHQKDVISSILDARFSPRSSLSLSSLVTGFVARLVTKALATGTVKKVSALSNIDREGVTRSAQAGADTGEDTGTPIDAIDGTPGGFVDVMQWFTQMDERVCPICRELEGQQWQIDDPAMPTPPDDTHESCRCRLDVVGTAADEVSSGAGGGEGGSDLLGLGTTATLGSTAIGLVPGSEECPEGQTWAPKKKKCQKCQPDEHTDLKTGDCVPDNCPKDKHWDDDLQRCVDDE